jgi:hypothetical protein
LLGTLPDMSLLLSLLIPSAHAACVVGADFLTLQDAVDGCTSGPITFDATYVPVADTDGVLITRDVDIDATGAILPPLWVSGAAASVTNGTAWADPTGIYSAMTVGSGSLTVTGTEFPPNGSFAIDAWDADVTVSDVTVEDYAAAAVFHADGGGFEHTFTLTDSTIARSLGHAVWLWGMDGTIARVAFSANQAETAGADVKLEGPGGNAVLVDQITSTNATAGYAGASIYAGNVDLTVLSSRFHAGSATYYGGAIAAASDNGVPVVVSLSDVGFDSTSAAFGGGLALWSANATIEGVDALHTRAYEAAGFLYAENSTITFTDGEIEGSKAQTSAGAARDAGSIYVLDSRLTIDGTRVFSPDTANLGGLVYLNQSELLGTGASFENAGAAKGGAIYAIGGSVVDLHEPYLHATWAGSGGAVYADHSDVTLTGAIVDTTSANLGGGVYSNSGAVRLAGVVARSPGGGTGGAFLMATAPRSLQIEGSRVCGAFSYDFSTIGVVEVVGRPMEPSEIRSTVFQDSYDVASVIRLASGEGGEAPMTIRNDDFLGNAPNVADVVVETDSAALSSNIHYRSGAAALSTQRPVSGGYALYHEVAGGEVVGDGAYENVEAVRADPLLAQDPAGNCDADVTLGDGSPAIDAGDPAWDAGTALNDIGAFPAELSVEDTDPPEDTDVAGDTDLADTDVTALPEAWISGGGGCGCRTASGAPSVSALLLLLALRRRAGAARR